MRSKVFVIVLAVAVAASGGTAYADFSFSDPAALPKSLPHADGSTDMAGWEPSLAFDPAGDGHLYSVAPGGGDNKGISFWGSADDGATWQYVRTIGSAAGGGDSDVDVGIDHTVYALDLEIASSAVCRSHDFGKSFEDGCETGAAQDQAGAEEDRQWLSHSLTDKNVVYFNYHDLSLQYPILEKSTDGGSSFSPCANLVDPSTQPGLFPSAIGNTIVGKAAVDKQENIYVPIGTPTPAQVATSGSATPPYGQIVIAYSKGCNGQQFSNTTVWSDDGGSFSNLFISNAVGPDGTVFVLANGKLKDTDNYNTYVWVSRDGAKTFSKPTKVNPPDLKTNVMGALTAGIKPGQLAVSWYGSTNASDPNDTKGEWRYYLAASDDYGSTWQRATITSNPFHYGDICTVGIACVTGNRNLLDFSSIGVNPKTGRYTTIFPGDPFDTFDVETDPNVPYPPAAAYISCQGGCGAAAVAGVRAGCHDRTPPASAISRAKSRFSRKGISLVGMVTDKGCGPGGHGTVVRESLAISRRVSKQCQWLRPKGGFGPKGSCRKKTYVTAKGTSKWTYALKAHLRPGIYAVVARGIDAVGNIEKPVRGSRANARHNHNHYLFKVQ